MILWQMFIVFCFILTLWQLLLYLPGSFSLCARQDFWGVKFFVFNFMRFLYLSNTSNTLECLQFICSHCLFGYVCSIFCFSGEVRGFHFDSISSFNFSVFFPLLLNLFSRSWVVLLYFRILSSTFLLRSLAVSLTSN